MNALDSLTAAAMRADTLGATQAAHTIRATERALRHGTITTGRAYVQARHAADDAGPIHGPSIVAALEYGTADPTPAMTAHTRGRAQAAAR